MSSRLLVAALTVLEDLSIFVPGGKRDVELFAGVGGDGGGQKGSLRKGRLPSTQARLFDFGEIP